MTSEIDIKVIVEEGGAEATVRLQESDAVRTAVNLPHGQSAYRHPSANETLQRSPDLREVHDQIEAGIDIMTRYAKTLEALAKT